jgi:peptide chain release factor 2
MRSLKRSPNFGGIFDLKGLQEHLSTLQHEVNQPDFWKNPASARSRIQEKTHLEKTIQKWDEIEKKLEDLSVLIQLAEEESASGGEASLKGEIIEAIKNLQAQIHHLEVEMLLSGEKDQNNAIVSIHPGAGGTESQDWAQMLFRMYTRWAERSGYKVELMDLQPGEEAGLKSATFNVIGDYAYGHLKAEAGVHRLVRISPFDANKRRHTSFSSVFVYPEIEDDVEVSINEKDLKMDTFRASGPGGQNVNKVSSAVRITHIPTGIVVACQTERSQHKNRSLALKLLRAKLYELEAKKKEAEMSSLVGEKKEIAWGNQIRSYVFQPYQMVKDHRTGVEIGNVEAVMDGDLDPLIDAYLQKQLKTPMAPRG